MSKLFGRRRARFGQIVESFSRLASRTLLLPLSICQVSVADGSWLLAKDADGIRVYTRSVANSPVREFKGEIELATHPNRVVATLKDANSFRQWMPDVVASEILHSSETEQYHYIEDAAPWPVSNRDGVYHFTFTGAEDAGVDVTTVRVEAAPDYLPVRDGKVRIPKADGFWKISAKGNGVALVYQIHADPGGSIPGWLANRAVVATPFNTLKNLRRYIQSSTE